MFDAYLQKRAKEKGEAFDPFDVVSDYRLYVDGKPRFDGVRDFLRSRSIKLPEGNLEDPAEAETVCGLGDRKDDIVNDAIAKYGVQPYQGSVRFIHQVLRKGFNRCGHLQSKLCSRS